jgi:peptidoglycan/LPS O-acetylase OafA/YrhL
MVVAAHMGWVSSPTQRASLGHGGVAVFFVLSGFLITHVLLDNRRGLAGFYAARAVRLLPALVVMLVAFGSIWLATGHDTADYLLQSALAVFYVKNFFVGPEHGVVLGHVWSLAVEEQFYLLWPLALIVLVRCTATLRLVLLTVFAGMSAALRLGLLGPVPLGAAPLVWVSLPSNAYALLGGCALGLAGRPPWLRPALATTTGLVLVVGAIVLTPAIPRQALGATIVVAAGALLLLAGAVDGNRVLESRVLRFVGRVSYAWYLWHWPLLVLAGSEFSPLRAVPCVVLSFVIAVVSTLVIEEPLRRRWRRRERAREPLADLG